MGFRFFRRIKIAPGVSLNFSKSGISPSFGVRGARVTLGRRGVRKTIGLPGTGLFYTEVGGSGGRRRSETGTRAESQESPRQHHRLDLGFFERLLTPKEERAFVDGCREYVAGRKDRALAELRESVHLADGAFLAGFLAKSEKRYDEAVDYLTRAAAEHRSLGRHLEKYGLRVDLLMPITEELAAEITPSRRGVLLGLAEVYQSQGKNKEALDCLQQLRKVVPEDVVVKLSLAELVLEAAPNNKRLAKQIVAIAGDVRNESAVHAALMLYKSRALRTLGLHEAARDVLTASLRKKKDRDADLLRALRYERACVYEELGQAKRSRREFEKLYAEAPDYEDVAGRLGLE